MRPVVLALSLWLATSAIGAPRFTRCCVDLGIPAVTGMQLALSP